MVFYFHHAFSYSYLWSTKKFSFRSSA